MADYELTRTPGERRLYALEGIGTLRLKGFAARAATAEADGSAWQIAQRARLEVVVLDDKGWGRRPVKVTADDLGAVEPGPLLFAAFVVRGSRKMPAAPPEPERRQQPLVVD